MDSLRDFSLEVTFDFSSTISSILDFREFVWESFIFFNVDS